MKQSTSGDLKLGWSFKASIDKDPEGNWVVTGLTISPTNELAKNIGLTTSVLRSIKINDLLDYEVEDMNLMERNLWFSHPDWEEERKEWLESIKGKWYHPGTRPHPEWMYARVAAFYLLARREDSSKPINLLAKWFDVDAKVASRRVDKARQLGMLTRPFKAKHDAPTGKSSGNLTSKCEEILGWKTTKSKKGKK